MQYIADVLLLAMSKHPLLLTRCFTFVTHANLKTTDVFTAIHHQMEDSGC